MKMKEKLKFLQIDTSNENFLMLNLFIDGTRKHLMIEEKRVHLKMLVPAIQELLKNNNLKISDLDFIALNEGPGSWTGLRIGFSTIKIICQINNIKLMVYSSFEVLMNKYKTNSGVFLVATNNSKFFYNVYSENELLSNGVIAEAELGGLFPQLKRYFYSNSELECKELLISKYQKNEFVDPKTVEPFYIVEGVIFNKFES